MKENESQPFRSKADNKTLMTMQYEPGIYNNLRAENIWSGWKGIRH